MLTVCSALALVCLADSGYAQSSADSGGQQQKSAASVEEFDRRIGPLKVKAQTFTITLHGKRLRETAEEAITRMDIRDETGKTVYGKSFPAELEVDHFVETTAVSARLLEGREGSGILVSYGVEPSTPLGGDSAQVFGIFNGRLVPFSKPLAVEGNLVEPEPASEKVLKTSAEPGLDGDILQFRLWTSNVFVFVPIKVDWIQAQVRPAWRCAQMTSRGWQPVCRFRVEAERMAAPGEELTFVRLLPEAFEPDAIAQHAVIKKDSKVEFPEAAGILRWEEQDDSIYIAVADDLWLKVRIDGKEGWIHTQEDFTAVGLPQAG